MRNLLQHEQVTGAAQPLIPRAPTVTIHDVLFSVIPYVDIPQQRHA